MLFDSSLHHSCIKFLSFADKYETVGEKLLKTYNVLRYDKSVLDVLVCRLCVLILKNRFIFFHSHISVVPPTPPPHLDYQFLSRSGVNY